MESKKSVTSAVLLLVAGFSLFNVCATYAVHLEGSWTLRNAGVAELPLMLLFAVIAMLHSLVIGLAALLARRRMLLKNCGRAGLLVALAALGICVSLAPQVLLLVVFAEELPRYMSLMFDTANGGLFGVAFYCGVVLYLSTIGRRVL